MPTSETPAALCRRPSRNRGSEPSKRWKTIASSLRRTSGGIRNWRRRDGCSPASPAPGLVMLTPAPITSMRDWSEVAVKGQVAEIFGNKFIVQDDSGRALVDTGRSGETGNSSPSPKR